MYPLLTAKPAAWGAGDLGGLQLVGASGGCVYDEGQRAYGSIAVSSPPV